MTIPYSVTTIGEKAFYECENLTVINYEGASEQWKSVKKGTSYIPTGVEIKCQE